MSGNEENFKDQDHLSSCGAERFKKAMKSNLKSYLRIVLKPFFLIFIFFVSRNIEFAPLYDINNGTHGLNMVMYKLEGKGGNLLNILNELHQTSYVVVGDASPEKYL